jgi:hypothetical protein
MPSERESRERSRKVSERWDYGVRGISDKRKRICNISQRLQRSMWFVEWPGSMDFLVPKLDALLLCACTMQLRRIRQWYQAWRGTVFLLYVLHAQQRRQQHELFSFVGEALWF